MDIVIDYYQDLDYTPFIGQNIKAYTTYYNNYEMGIESSLALYRDDDSLLFSAVRNQFDLIKVTNSLVSCQKGDEIASQDVACGIHTAYSMDCTVDGATYKLGWGDSVEFKMGSHTYELVHHFRESLDYTNEQMADCSSLGWHLSIIDQQLHQ